MCKVIAIANHKGGVAKTTSAMNLGRSLADLNYNVLLVDLDSQASLTISSGIEPLELEKTIVDVLYKESSNPSESIVPLSNRISIIPSIIDLAAIETQMISRTGRDRILDRALNKIKNRYDFIILDCPPSLGMLTLNALSASDYVVIPVKTDYLAYRGMDQIINQIEEAKEFVNPKLKIIGIIATMFESRIKDDNAILKLLSENYNVLGVVKKLAIAKKGAVVGKSAVELYPNSDISVEYNKIANEIIKRV